MQCSGEPQDTCSSALELSIVQIGYWKRPSYCGWRQVTQVRYCEGRWAAAQRERGETERTGTVVVGAGQAGARASPTYTEYRCVEFSMDFERVCASRVFGLWIRSLSSYTKHPVFVALSEHVLIVTQSDTGTVTHIDRDPIGYWKRPKYSTLGRAVLLLSPKALTPATYGSL